MKIGRTSLSDEAVKELKELTVEEAKETPQYSSLRAEILEKVCKRATKKKSKK